MARIVCSVMALCYRGEGWEIKVEMTNRFAERLRDYTRTVSAIGSYAALGVIWFAILRVFLGHMMPRIAGILRHVPLANTPPCDAAQCDFSVFWPAGLLARLG